MQYLPTEHTAQEGYHDGKHSTYPQRVGHIRAHLHIVLSTESLRYRYGKASTRTVAEAHDKEHHTRCGTHGRQRVHAYPATHDGRVYNEVHLLQDITQNQWNGKMQNAARRTAHRHIIHIAHLSADYII